MVEKKVRIDNEMKRNIKYSDSRVVVFANDDYHDSAVINYRYELNYRYDTMHDFVPANGYFVIIINVGERSSAHINLCEEHSRIYNICTFIHIPIKRKRERLRERLCACRRE